MEFLNKKYGISGFTKNLYEISGLRFPIQGPLPRKLGMVILYTGTNNLKSNQNLSNIANGIISLAKNIKSSGTKASISLRERKKIPRNVPQSDVAFISHKNINRRLDLFRTSSILMKKGQGILNPFTSMGRYIGLILLCQKCPVADISAVNTCVRKT